MLGVLARFVVIPRSGGLKVGSRADFSSPRHTLTLRLAVRFGVSWQWSFKVVWLFFHFGILRVVRSLAVRVRFVGIWVFLSDVFCRFTGVFSSSRRGICRVVTGLISNSTVVVIGRVFLLIFGFAILWYFAIERKMATLAACIANYFGAFSPGMPNGMTM